MVVSKQLIDGKRLICSPLSSNLTAEQYCLYKQVTSKFLCPYFTIPHKFLRVLGQIPSSTTDISALALASNPVFDAHTKHIEVDFSILCVEW